MNMSLKEVQIIRLLEYETKEVFDEYNIPLLSRIVIMKGDNIIEKLEKFSFPAIIKSQIAIGSRKKAGLIKIAKTIEEGYSLCLEFFQKNISGYSVEAILIEELANIQQEYYCSIALDSSTRQFILIASKEGGIDIEKVALIRPEAILKEKISIGKGLNETASINVAKKLGFSDNNLKAVSNIFLNLWNIIIEKEAHLVEINPLALTATGIIALDGKMLVDDNAAFRLPWIIKLKEKKLTNLEKIAQNAGFSFVELDGDIGILANGAGLTMALLDVLAQYGLRPVNFLDVGGGASQERIFEALKLLFKLNPKAIFVNIYGGITRCDVVAEAIVKALEEFPEAPRSSCTLIIRLTGTMEKEGIEILTKAGLEAYHDMLTAIERLNECE